jgi:hypothetical protein
MAITGEGGVKDTTNSKVRGTRLLLAHIQKYSGKTTANHTPRRVTNAGPPMMRLYRMSGIRAKLEPSGTFIHPTVSKADMEA